MKQVYLLATLLILAMFTPFITFAESEEKEKVIVIFKESINEELLIDLEGEMIKTFDHLSAASAELSLDAIEELEAHQEVLTIELDHIVSINSQIIDWGIEKVNAPLAWQSNFTGKGVKVAILDTGISPHDDLYIAGGVAITAYTDSYYDDNGHGTHIAGIIGAKDNGIGVVGVAPDAQLYAVKVLNEAGTGRVSDIIAGIDWAISNQMDVINLSLSTKMDSSSLKQIVDRAYNKGIIVVASAGNSGNGKGNTVEYPARYDSAIAVSAINANNNRGSFSASGPTIELTAPGVNIYSTYINNNYARLDGTSMASAFVVGTIALLKEAQPNLTHQHYRKLVQDMALDLGPKGRDDHFGFGLVQAPFIKPGQSDHELLVLMEGDRRPEVIQLKLDLERAGFRVSTNPNNYYGPITTSRVRQFQQAHGIFADGIAGPITLQKLKEVTSLSLKEGDRRPEVIQLKLDLERAGFRVSTNPNNYYGPITTTRVREFQRAYGLPVDGIAGPATLQKLREISSRSLKEGDRRSEVIKLKLDLDKAGYRVSTNPNNFFGPITTQKVRQFQSHNQLRVTGVADLATLEKLNNVKNQPLKEGDRKHGVIQLKQDLEKAGFFVSANPNNFYGSITTRQVKRFQSSVGLPTTGVADLTTRIKLIEKIKR